jgi:SNF2 family DNA or RNA helicase
LYREVYNNILANADMIKESNNPLAEMIRLRQVTGYTGILSTTIKESAKLDRMLELVEDAIANGKKIVIFSNWTQMTAAVEQKLFENNIHCYDTITGETKDEDRQYKVNSFQTDDEGCKILIGTIGAMGTGLTLTAGTVEIFMDEPWTMAAKEQAIDRCHRIGQNNNITIYTLLTKNTIDEKVNTIVAQKGAMSDMLIDGKVTDKKALVDYLLS